MPIKRLSVAFMLSAFSVAGHAAEDVAKQAKKGGLSDEAAEAIRKQILGIAS